MAAPQLGGLEWAAGSAALRRTKSIELHLASAYVSQQQQKKRIRHEQ